MKRFLCVLSLTFCMLNVSVVLAQPGFSWAKNIGGSGGEVPECITVDGNGNVYSTGSFQLSADLDPGPSFANVSSNGASDIFISKLDASGNFIWGKSLGSNLNDVGYSIAVNAAGDVFVAGYVTGTIDFDPGPGTYTVAGAGNCDIFILKLDASGNFVWVKNIGAGNNDIAYGLALDNTGNIYTTGIFLNIVDFDPGPGTFTLSTIGQGDIFVSKLDGNGDFVWAKQICSVNNETGYSIAVDASQNVYTTGNFFMNADFDPGPATYNISVTGTAAYVSKLDVNGDFVWAQAFTGSGVTGKCVKTDNASNVYVTGYFSATGDFDPSASTYSFTSAGQSDIYVSKLDANGAFVWANQIGSTGYDRGHSLALDASQNVYTTGYFQSTADFDPGAGTYTLASAGAEDIYINKFNSAGNFIWAYALGGANYDQGSAIAVDGSNNIYTTGYFVGNPSCDLDPTASTFTVVPSGSSDIFIQKLNQCVAPAPPANTTPTLNVLICQGNTTTLTAIGSGTISWFASVSSATSIGSGTSIVTPTLAAGTYTYYAEDSTCSVSVSRTAIMFTVSACTGIKTEKSAGVFNIYPNPAKENVHLMFSSTGERTIRIYNSIGQIVHSSKTSEQNMIVDIKDLHTGIYFIEIRTPSQTLTQKLIKN